MNRYIAVSQTFADALAHHRKVVRMREELFSPKAILRFWPTFGAHSKRK